MPLWRRGWDRRWKQRPRSFSEEKRVSDNPQKQISTARVCEASKHTVGHWVFGLVIYERLYSLQGICPGVASSYEIIGIKLARRLRQSRTSLLIAVCEGT